MSLCQRCWPPRGLSKGGGAIRKPWGMYLWRGLVQLLQLATKEHNDDDDDKATLTMTATMAMAETATATGVATAMATATAMLIAMFLPPPLPLTATMLMTMMAAFKDGNRTMAVGRQ
jgi:hypothetical protein